MKLVVADLARADLREIARRTAEVWGERQKKKYLIELRGAFRGLLQYPELGRERPDIRKGYRSLVVARHVVFYRLTSDSIVILRILHHRMDAKSHL